MGEQKVRNFREYIQSGHFGYAVKLGNRKRGEPNTLVGEPRQGLPALEDLLDHLDTEGVSYYVRRVSANTKHDSVGNNIDGEAVDLETAEWLGKFQKGSDKKTSTPMTLVYIPDINIELDRNSTPEEVAIVGDLLGLIAELRLIKGLEPSQSLDETIV